MEHAQREPPKDASVFDSYFVLILILMEHAQRVSMIISKIFMTAVLILILMEHAQRGKDKHETDRSVAHRS